MPFREGRNPGMLRFLNLGLATLIVLSVASGYWVSGALPRGSDDVGRIQFPANTGAGTQLRLQVRGLEVITEDVDWFGGRRRRVPAVLVLRSQSIETADRPMIGLSTELLRKDTGIPLWSRIVDIEAEGPAALRRDAMRAIRAGFRLTTAGAESVLPPRLHETPPEPGQAPVSI